MRAATRRVRRALSLSSLFYHPDVEMDGFELLSRASACLVPVADASLPFKYHVMASQHVTHPWRYPAYYSPEKYPFVHVLEDEHVKCQVEVREEGTPVVVAPLQHASFVHPLRDLSIFHLENEDEFLASAAKAGFTVGACELCPERAPLQTALVFDGHELTRNCGSKCDDCDDAGTCRPNGVAGDDAAAAGASPVVEDSNDSFLLPRVVDGHVLARSDRQVFARTRSVLQMGMCGGPVLLENQSHDGSSSVAVARAGGTGVPLARCVGIVEGIVPTDFAAAATAGSAADAATTAARQALAGTAVYVESDEILAFLRTVEERMRRVEAMR